VRSGAEGDERPSLQAAGERSAPALMVACKGVCLTVNLTVQGQLLSSSRP